MKISSILAKPQPSVSFEVFPPKKDRPLEGTKELVSEIAATQSLAGTGASPHRVPDKDRETM